MAKAVFHRRFDATDITKGVSIRIEPMDGPQSFPEWVIAMAEAAGAATRVSKPRRDVGEEKEGQDHGIA